MVQFSSLAQAFGGGEEEQQTSVPATSFAVQPQLVDDLRSLRTEQQPSETDVLALREQQGRAVAAHTEFAQSRTAMQGQLEERSADLESVKGFLDATNPAVSRQARTFQLRHWLKAQGVDPKSESARELVQLATSLPSEELSALRGSLVEQSQSAPPGSMRKLFNAVGNGQIPAASLFQNVADYSARTAQTAQNEAAQLQAPQAPTARVPVPQNTEVPALHREVPPEIAGILPGLEPGRRYRYSDIQQMFPTLPSDEAGLRKFAQDYRDGNARTFTTLSHIRDLQTLLDKGGAAAVGPTGFMNRMIDWGKEQLSGLTGIATELLPDPQSRAIANAVNSTTQRILASHKIEADAETAARVRASVTALVYSTARSQDPGGRLSDADVIAATRVIGASGSVNQMRATLTDVATRLHNEFGDKMRSAAGADVPLNVRSLSPAQLQSIVESPSMPTELRRAALDHARVLRDRQQSQTTPTAPATAEPAQSPTERVEPQPTQRQPTPRAQPERRSGVPTIEQDEAGRVAQQDFYTQQAIQDRMRQHRREDAADTSRDSHLALALANFHRAAEWRKEDKAETRQQRIAAAFKEFGKAIGASAPRMSAGGSGSSGGQDMSAFRLPARPRREPPRIPQIKKRGD